MSVPTKTSVNFIFFQNNNLTLMSLEYWDRYVITGSTTPIEIRAVDLAAIGELSVSMPPAQTGPPRKRR